MRSEWIAASLVVLIVGSAAIVWFLRLQRKRAANITASLVVLYAWVVLFLLSMESDWLLEPSVNIAGFLKKSLLSLSGGLLAAAIVELNRVANAPSSQGRVSRVFLRGVLGALCGFVAAGLAGAVSPPFAGLTDEVAVIAGVAGGGCRCYGRGCGEAVVEYQGRPMRRSG